MRLLQFFIFLLSGLSLYSYKTWEERKEDVGNLVQQMLQGGSSLGDIYYQTYKLKEATKEIKDLDLLYEREKRHKDWIEDNRYRMRRKLAKELKKESDDYRNKIRNQKEIYWNTPEYLAHDKISTIIDLNAKLREERKQIERYKFMDEASGGPNLLGDIEKNIEDLLQQKEIILQEWPFV